MSHENEKSSPTTHGIGWTGKTLTSFEQYFPKLPAELRVKVWSFITPEPRVIKLDASPSGDKVITRTSTPSYLQVCRESRYEGLKSYENLAYKGALHCILVNFEIDTVIFTHGLFLHANPVDLEDVKLKYSKLRSMGIHYSGCMRTNAVNKKLDLYTSLEKFYLIFDGYPHRGRYQRLSRNGELKEVRDTVLDGKPCCLCHVPRFKHFSRDLLGNIMDRVIRRSTSQFMRTLEFSERAQRYLPLPHMRNPNQIKAAVYNNRLQTFSFEQLMEFSNQARLELEQIASGIHNEELFHYMSNSSGHKNWRCTGALRWMPASTRRLVAAVEKFEVAKIYMGMVLTNVCLYGYSGWTILTAPQRLRFEIPWI